MKLGLIGLGKMGMNLVLNMQDNGYMLVGMDFNFINFSIVSVYGLVMVMDFINLFDQLLILWIVWIMVFVGKVINSVIEQLVQILSVGDIVFDGGNLYY